MELLASAKHNFSGFGSLVELCDVLVPVRRYMASTWMCWCFGNGSSMSSPIIIPGLFKMTGYIPVSFSF